MQAIDRATLKEQLVSLADAFGSKPVTDKGVMVWLDTLKEFATHEVMSLLIEWPKYHGKVPVPHEVWRILNERSTDTLEEQAKRDKAQFERDARAWVATPAGKAASAALLKSMKARGRESIAEKCLRNSREALRRHESGEFQLPSWVIEHHKARVADADHFADVSKMVERQPGDDFEEDAVEVAA